MPINPVEVVGGIAIGEGVGAAVADVVEPQLRTLKNTQSAQHPHVPLPGELAARLIAESITADGVNPGTDALYHGYDGSRFNAMIELARRYPPLPEALTLWRRGLANYGNVSGWLNRAGLSDEIVRQMIGAGPDPARLFFERLEPSVVAVAVQRGLLPNDGILPVAPPITGGTVPPMPQVALDPFTEARAAGIDDDRLKVLARIVGLPASPDLAARMVFRNIIERTDFDRAVAEGNTRNEWAPFLFDGFREILTAHNYAELQLRGYLDRRERLDGTDKHGMSHRESDLLFDVLGRAIPVHQVVTGEARGGDYNGPSGNIPEAFLRSLQRGNLRPEYYNLAYANRYTYPSFFAVRGLMQGGVLNAAQGHEILLEMGWKPSLATLVSDFYAKPATAAADPHVAKAQTQLWTTTHRSYIAAESDDAQATAALEAAGVAASAVPQILVLWEHERSLIRRQLTPAQVKKAYLKASRNFATGQPWTLDDALAALVARGYSLTEANDFLAIPTGP